MLDKMIVVTQQKISFFGLNESGAIIRDYLQGEESQDITNQPGESLTRVLYYVQEAQLVHGCNIVRVLYDEELDTNMLNCLVDFIKAIVKSYEVIQFKTMLPELLVKSASTEINSPLHVQLCEIAYRIDIDDTKLKISRQNDPESTTDFVWNDENLVRLTINDSYPSLNACKTEELQGKIKKLEEKIGIKAQESIKTREDLKKAKQEIVLKTNAHVACLKELQVFRDKEQKEKKRIAFKAYDVPKLQKYISAINNVTYNFSNPIYAALKSTLRDDPITLIAKRMVKPEELTTKNQPIFQFIVDTENRTGLGEYKHILKAGCSGRIFCFSKSMGERMNSSLKDLVAKLQDGLESEYNPVLFVIADENDTEEEIRQWCWAQGYDVYE